MQQGLSRSHFYPRHPKFPTLWSTRAQLCWSTAPICGHIAFASFAQLPDPTSPSPNSKKRQLFQTIIGLIHMDHKIRYKICTDASKAPYNILFKVVRHFQKISSHEWLLIGKKDTLNKHPRMVKLCVLSCIAPVWILSVTFLASYLPISLVCIWIFLLCSKSSASHFFSSSG